MKEEKGLMCVSLLYDTDIHYISAWAFMLIELTVYCKAVRLKQAKPPPFHLQPQYIWWLFSIKSQWYLLPADMLLPMAVCFKNVSSCK